MPSFETLFIASVSLLGFISLFIIFRYRTIDTYIDNRKNALRLLLATEIQIKPIITVYIQSIGKIKKETKKLTNLVKNPNKKNTVKIFANQIRDFRAKRERTISLGLISIILWAYLSVSSLFNIHSKIFSTYLFVLFLIFTLFFISIELFEGFGKNKLE